MLQNFAFEEHLVRVIDRAGDPWFVGVDICRAMGLSKPENALSTLDDDEKYTLTEGVLSDKRGPDARLVVSEPGVYRLVFRSRKPEAERFKRWLAHDVLPAIRKTGRFGPEPDGSPPSADMLLMDAPLGAKVDFLRWVQKGRGFEVAASFLPALGLPSLPSLKLPNSGSAGQEVLNRIVETGQGIRAGDGGIWIANPVAAELFAGTGLSQSWLNALRSLPGVIAGGRQTIEGEQVRTTWVPDETLAQAS